MAKYAARPGSPITNGQAQVLGEHIEAMQERGETVTPAAIVEEAKAKNSPLHEMFDWNDHSAAERHRLDHARVLVGSIRIVEFSVKQKAKAFHSILVEQQDGTMRHGYEPRRRILVDSDARSQVSAALYGRLLSIVAEASSLGLPAEDVRWESIVAVVRSNQPMASTLEAMKQTA